MKPAQLGRVSYRGPARGAPGRAEPAPRYPAALPRAGVVYSRGAARAANGQRLPALWPARLRAAPGGPRSLPRSGTAAGAPRTPRGAARRSLCECVRGVCAPAAPSRAAGVTAALSGRRARRSARRPMAGRLISRGVLWRCPGCMALCGAAFRGRRGGGAALRAASGPAARCAPRRGECPGPPTRTGRAEMGSGRQGGRERGRDRERGALAPRVTLRAPVAGQPPAPLLRRWRTGGRRGASLARRGGCRGSQSLFLPLASPAFVLKVWAAEDGWVPALRPAGRAGVTGGV